MARARSSVLVGLLTVLAVGSALVAVPTRATAVDPSADEAVVVQLPSSSRAVPRRVSMLRQTDDGRLVMSREIESERVPDPYQSSETVVVADDGDEQQLQGDGYGTIVDVVGNRLIDRSWPGVSSQVVGEPDWSPAQVPDGATWLGYTADGYLIATGPAHDRSMRLLSWDGATDVPIPGVPSGLTLAEWTRVGSGSLTLVVGYSGGETTWLMVDTSAQRTWAFQMVGACAGPISFGMNEGKLVWQTAPGASQVLCSIDVPDPDVTEAGPITSRPSTTLPFDAGHGDYDLTPVGEDILVTYPDPFPAPWWGEGPQQRLVAVHPDGSTRILSRWAYEVTPSKDGHVLAMTGEGPGDEQVSDIDVASGDVSEALPIARIPAFQHGIAVDGDRVVYSDDSRYRKAVSELTVDFEAGTVTEPKVLDTEVEGVVAAGGGGSAWSKSGDSAPAGVHLAADGHRTTRGSGYVVDTDGRWELDTNGAIWDSVTDTYRPSRPAYDRGSLQDGVAYAPGSAIPGAPEASVLATDLESGETAAIPVPGCRKIHSVSVAGSWLLASCTATSGEWIRVVVDRTGASPSRELDLDQYLDVQLGNGFVVVREETGELTWAPLAGPDWDWQPLGVAADWSGYPDDYWDLAITRGLEPTVAWRRGREAYAARIPVETSPLPPHPSGVLPPLALVGAQAVGVDHAIRVEWDRPADAADILGYEVTATATSALAATRTRVVNAEAMATSVTIPNVTNGFAYAVSITATTIAGARTTDVAGQATPMLPPLAPSNVRVAVDRASGRATVTWSHAAGAGREAVRSFSVEYDNGQIAATPADARSLTFVIPKAPEGWVYVTANGAAQQSHPAASAATVFPEPPPSPLPTSDPDPDTVAPVGTLAPLPAVVLDGELKLSVGASDDRALAMNPLQIRWRTTGDAQPLGDWTVPTRWRATPAGTKWVHLAPGQAACFSARARDDRGNMSAWSEQRCSVAAYDDRALRRVGKTHRVTGKGYLRGAATALRGGRSSLQARVTTPGTGGWLVARTCPRCGQVKVVLGSTVLGTIDLRSKVARNQRVLAFPQWPATPRRGQLRLTPTGREGDVVIDGFALRTY